jgi:hypothetical protein
MRGLNHHSGGQQGRDFLDCSHHNTPSFFLRTVLDLEHFNVCNLEFPRTGEKHLRPCPVSLVEPSPKKVAFSALVLQRLETHPE